MITLGNVKIISLMPTFMKSDIFTTAVCDALSPYFNQMEEDNLAYLIYVQIDRLDSDALDELAWEMNCTWYAPSESIEIRRDVLKNAIKVHMIKGTPAAVEMVIGSVFGSGRVEEWFDFGGTPGTFRVMTDNVTATGAQANRFIEIIEAVKRKSAHLDQIIIEMAAQLNMYVGVAVHTGDTLTIRQVV